MRTIEWRGLALAALVLVGLGASTAATAYSSVEGRRISRCLLEVDGRTYIDGPCDFEAIDDAGSFTITEAAARPFFGYLLIGEGTAEGYWNETRGGAHAHADLGPMRRDGACWRNRRARICAWR